MPLTVKYHHTSPGVWVERSDRRVRAPRRDLRDPGFRRRRALAILALSRAGFPVPDIAIWMGLSEQRTNALRRKAAVFAAAVLHHG